MKRKKNRPYSWEKKNAETVQLLAQTKVMLAERDKKLKQRDLSLAYKNKKLKDEDIALAKLHARIAELESYI